MSTNFDEIFCRVGFVIMTGSRRLDFVDDSDRDAAAAASSSSSKVFRPYALLRVPETSTLLTCQRGHERQS